MTFTALMDDKQSAARRTLSSKCTVSRDTGLGCCASYIDATNVKSLHRAALAADVAKYACSMAAGESYITCSFSSSRALDTASSRCTDTGNVSAGALKSQMTSRSSQAAHLHVKLINVLLDCCIKLILHRKHLPSSSLLQFRSLIRQGLLPGRPAVGLPLR